MRNIPASSFLFFSFGLVFLFPVTYAIFLVCFPHQSLANVVLHLPRAGARHLVARSSLALVWHLVFLQSVVLESICPSLRGGHAAELGLRVRQHSGEMTAGTAKVRI